MATFFEMIQGRWDSVGARICVGLDTNPEKIPKGHDVTSFNCGIVSATKDRTLAYKPNIAFYSGQKHLRDHLLATVAFIRKWAPDVPIILDAKRGDIDNTNLGYVAEAFDLYGTDAVTVSHYLGSKAMQPFLKQTDKGIIVLCATSNEGAEEMQDVIVVHEGRQIPYYQYVANRVRERWNENGNCALVVGATYPTRLGVVRREIGDKMWMLNPGIGAQSGSIQDSAKHGRNFNGSGLIFSASRSIQYASSGDDFADAAGAELDRLTDRAFEAFELA